MIAPSHQVLAANAAATFPGNHSPHVRRVLTTALLATAAQKFSDWPTFPQLYAGGELLGGADIVAAMADAGDLKPALDLAVASVQTAGSRSQAAAAALSPAAPRAGAQTPVTPSRRMEATESPSMKGAVFGCSTCFVRSHA